MIYIFTLIGLALISTAIASARAARRRHRNPFQRP